ERHHGHAACGQAAGDARHPRMTFPGAGTMSEDEERRVRTGVVALHRPILGLSRRASASATLVLNAQEMLASVSPFLEPEGPGGPIGPAGPTRSQPLEFASTTYIHVDLLM